MSGAGRRVDAVGSFEGVAARLAVFGTAVALLAAGAPPAGAADPPAASRPAASDPASPSTALEERDLPGHTGAVTSVAFFPDGRRLASAGRDGVVRIWDLVTGESRAFDRHGKTVWAVAVSADGSLVASASADGTVRAWNAADGSVVGLLEGHVRGARACAFLPDGRLLTGGGDGLRLWDVKAEKLLWRDRGASGGVYALAVTPDGKTAALVSQANAGTQVWDLAQRKAVRAFPPSPLLQFHPALSPDGQQVWGPAGDGALRIRRWDLATAIEQTVPEDLWAAHMVAYAPDGRRLVAPDMRAHALTVREAPSLRPVHSIPIEQRGEGVMSLAVSPDGRTVAAGLGRVHEQSEVPAGLLPSPILIRRLSADGAPAAERVAVGPREGQVSWEVIPVRVDGIDPADADAATFVPGRQARARRLAGDLDAIWDVRGAYLHRGEKGRLTRVFAAKNGDQEQVVHDVAYDGTHVWIATGTAELIVVDTDGKTVCRVTPPAPAFGHAAVHALGPGRVLVAGSGEFGKPLRPGWCALVELPGAGAAPAGARPAVRMLLTEKDLPADWTNTVARGAQAVLMRPLYFMEMAGGQGTPRSVYLVCDRMHGQPQPMFRIDPTTLAATPYNVLPQAGGRISIPGDVVDLPEQSRPLALDGRRLLYQVGAAVRVATLIPDARPTASLVCWPVTPPRLPPQSHPILTAGGSMYVPGRRWYRVDLTGRAAVDIGPGLRDKGEFDNDDDVVYFESGVLGMAAFSPSRSALYRFSVDPQHPAPVVATASLPTGRPVPPGGVIEIDQDHVGFVTDVGALWFDQGKVSHDRSVPAKWRDPHAAERAEIDLARHVRMHVQSPDFAERAGVSREQAKRAGGGFEAPITPNEAKVNQLYAAWVEAADGPAKEQAAKAIFEQARALGETDLQRGRQRLAETRQALTPRQWKILTDQAVGPDDK